MKNIRGVLAAAALSIIFCGALMARDDSPAFHSGLAIFQASAGPVSPPAPPVRQAAPYKSPGALNPDTTIYGVTIDRIGNLPAAIASLRTLPHKPTVRIVFDEVPAAGYTEAVDGIRQVGFIMGQVVDSSYMKDYTVEQHAKRVKEYLDAFRGKVDIWEIANEINGDWLGNDAEVVQKMKDAYSLVKKSGGKTALTLHYGNGYPDNPEHEMFSWASKNIPTDMKAGLDYVLVSYYENEPGCVAPDFEALFQRLATMFPNAKVGFGETGTEDPALKSAFIRRFYGMRLKNPRYIGGCFWWYFSTDMVPASPLLDLLNNEIR